MSTTLFRGRMHSLKIALIAGGVAALAVIPACALAATTIEACADCHGKAGASTEPDVPIIGGQSADVLSDELADYRDNKRPCPESKYRAGDTARPVTTMCKIAKELSPAEVTTITEELASKPFVRAKQPFDAAQAKIGKAVHSMHCEKCHSEGGSSKDDDAGILAGQWTKYLTGAFKELADGKRPMPEKMKPKFEELKPQEREALLQYYASFQ